MRRGTLLLMCCAPLAGMFAGPAWATEASLDWPTVQHDMQRTGYTPSCPEPPYRIRWVWTNGDRIDPEKMAEAAKKNVSPFFGLFPDVVTARFMNHAQPMVADGVAYIASVSMSTRNPMGPGELFAIDVKTGATKWHSATSGPAFHCVTVVGGQVFVATARGLDAFDLSGKKLWTFAEPRRGNFRGCPAFAEAATAGKPAVVAQPPSAVVLAGSTSGFFYGVDAKTGKAKWEYDAGGPIYQVPAVYQDSVYFGSDDNMNFHCLDVGTGKLKWKNAEVYGRSYWYYWPVIAPQAGVVMFQTHAKGAQHGSGMDVVAKAPNDYIKAQDAFREYLEKTPEQQSFYVLDLKDGKQRFKIGTGHAGFSCDLMPPPIVRTEGDKEIVYSYHYAQQGTFQQGGQFQGYSHPVDFGMINFKTGYFERTGPVGSNACPVICRFDDFHQTTMGDSFLFGLQNDRGMGCTSVGQEKRTAWSDKAGQGLWGAYDRRGMDGLIGAWHEHNFHWGGTTCATLLPDAVLVSPFGGLYIVCYESEQK